MTLHANQLQIGTAATRPHATVGQEDAVYPLMVQEMVTRNRI